MKHSGLDHLRHTYTAMRFFAKVKVHLKGILKFKILTDGIWIVLTIRCVKVSIVLKERASCQLTKRNRKEAS